MKMDTYKELVEIKNILAAIVRTSNLPEDKRFTSERLEKAAKAYQKLCVERGDWIEESEINSVIKNAPYHSGKFLQDEFGFLNCFKYGRSMYYNREDLLKLKTELKDRNIDLKRFMEYRADQDKFQKGIATALEKSAMKSFKIPDDLSDITTSRVVPDIGLIRQDIKALRREYKTEQLSEYVDIYRNNHAMVKFEYMFEKYIDSAVRRRCNKWCDNFNYAQNALSEAKAELKGAGPEKQTGEEPTDV